MEDAQFPPEAGDAGRAPAPRSRKRLSDAEAVATTRLDMFGDNSLKEALSGGAPGGGEVPADATDATPADQPPPAGSAADAAGPAVPDPTLSDAPPQPPPPPVIELHPLDRAADVEREPAALDPDHDNSNTSPASEFASPSLDQSSEPEPDPAASPAARMQVSSIFDTLDAAEERADAPPASESGSPGPDQSSGPEPDPAAGVPASRMQISSIFDALDTAEGRADALPEPEFGSPGLDQSAEPEPDPTTAAILAPMEVPSIFDALDATDEHAEAERNDETPPALSSTPDPTPPGLPVHNGWPSVPAELISKAREEGDAVAEDASDAASRAESPAETSPTAQDADSLADPAEAPPDPPPTPSFPGFSAGPPFPDPSGVAQSAELSHPPPFFRSELEPNPAPPMLDDPAAQIAAEATATAEALDNLRHLLKNKLPDLEDAEPASRQPDRTGERVVSSPPLVDDLRMNLEPELPPFAGRQTTPLMPLMPLPLPPERSSRGVYLLGFLTGLALSVMAGAVLYFFISLG